MRARTPSVDRETRERLAARFGREIGAWLDELPRVLSGLADQWELEFDSVIPRSSVAVVIRCHMSDGHPAVLKVSPDRRRLANEAAALGRWTTGHTPSVFAVDEGVGALLLEAIDPGTSLVESLAYPRLESVAELLTSLHAGVPGKSFPRLADRVTYLFDSGEKAYRRHPDLAELIPVELYERGRQFATQLASNIPLTALLHGDLTPRNILDGGRRGLVAIDPAPCLGNDLAFDAIDLVLWRADGVATIAERAKALAARIGADAGRLLDWCTAFAAMTALELAEAPDGSTKRVETYVTLAARAPTL
jgi:streptomycin 6-kinase